MCNIKEHFKKHNQWYSFGFLLILTLAVVYLFIKVDALDYDVDRQVNEPYFNHNLTLQKYEKKQAMEIEEKAKKGEPLVVVGTEGQPLPESTSGVYVK